MPNPKRQTDLVANEGEKFPRARSSARLTEINDRSIDPRTGDSGWGTGAGTGLD